MNKQTETRKERKESQTTEAAENKIHVLVYQIEFYQNQNIM